MTARLVALAGPLSGSAVPLRTPEVAIGREDGVHLTITDPSVSPRHCVITCAPEGLRIRELDRANPTFVNGLPATDAVLRDGDQIQVGTSLFVVRLNDTKDIDASEAVRLRETLPSAPSVTVMSREEMLQPRSAATPVLERAARDLDALMRISAAISGIHGLVALERPLIALLAEVIPVERGAILLSADGVSELDSVGWSRHARATTPLAVSRSVVNRVLRDTVGLLWHEPPSPPVLAAPLASFDKPIGVLMVEAAEGGPQFDEGHLRLLMAIGGMAGTSLAYARQVEDLEGANRRLRAELNLDHNMVGESAAMRDVYRRIARVAPTDSTVLITGESGTGKELVARAIHRNSPRAARPFVAINCAAITETLLESELFGHEKGAFTGAIAQKKGKLEIAEGGTVLLDEIGELSLALQAKLLRVLQDREFDRVGGTRRVRVDFRLIAATNRDLEAAIDAGQFRRDLYYRLNVVSLGLPPLRDRRDDIALLANWFVRQHAGKSRRAVTGFSKPALACLTAYDWPGNVRELENAIEHAIVLGVDPTITPDDLPDAIAESASPQSLGSDDPRRFHDAVKKTKKDLILRAVEEAGGNYNAAARLLGLHPNYLHRLIRNLQLKPILKT